MFFYVNVSDNKIGFGVKSTAGVVKYILNKTAKNTKEFDLRNVLLRSVMRLNFLQEFIKKNSRKYIISGEKHNDQ